MWSPDRRPHRLPPNSRWHDGHDRRAARRRPRTRAPTGSRRGPHRRSAPVARRRAPDLHDHEHAYRRDQSGSSTPTGPEPSTHPTGSRLPRPAGLAAPAAGRPRPDRVAHLPIRRATRTNDSTPPFAGTASDAAGDSPTVPGRVYAGSRHRQPPCARSASRARAPAGRSAARQRRGARAPCGEGAYTVVASQDGHGGTGSASSALRRRHAPRRRPCSSGPTSRPPHRTPKLTGYRRDGRGDDGSVRVRVYAGPVASGSPLKAVFGASPSPERSPPRSGCSPTAPTSRPRRRATRPATARRAHRSRSRSLRAVGAHRASCATRSTTTTSTACGLDGAGAAQPHEPRRDRRGARRSPTTARAMVFTSTREGQRDIFVRETRDRRRHAASPIRRVHELDPACRPMATRIAFWRAGLDCPTGPTSWTPTAPASTHRAAGERRVANDEHPSWSPDSTQLVLSSRYFTGRRHLATTSRSSIPTTRRRAHNGGAGGVDARPAARVIDEIEPRGRPMASTSPSARCRTGSSGAIGQLHVVDLADPHRPLRRGPRAASSPTRPGRPTARTSSSRAPSLEDGNDSIQLIDADGTGLSTIPTGVGMPRQPAWQPPLLFPRSRPSALSHPRGGGRTNDTTPPFAGTAGRRQGDDDDGRARVFAGSDTRRRRCARSSGRGPQPLGARAGRVGRGRGGCAHRSAEGGYTVVASQSGSGGTGSASSGFVVDVTAPRRCCRGRPASVARPHAEAHGLRRHGEPATTASCASRVYAGSPRAARR